MVSKHAHFHNNNHSRNTIKCFQEINCLQAFTSCLEAFLVNFQHKTFFKVTTIHVHDLPLLKHRPSVKNTHSVRPKITARQGMYLLFRIRPSFFSSDRYITSSLLKFEVFLKYFHRVFMFVWERKTRGQRRPYAAAPPKDSPPFHPRRSTPLSQNHYTTL